MRAVFLMRLYKNARIIGKRGEFYPYDPVYIDSGSILMKEAAAAPAVPAVWVTAKENLRKLRHAEERLDVLSDCSVFLTLRH